jgi:hypothetical protein
MDIRKPGQWTKISCRPWQKVTRSLPVMGFLQISHTSWHISKEEQVIDLILIRLISLHSNGLQEIFVHWPGFRMSMLMLWSFLIRFYFINICLTTGIKIRSITCSSLLICHDVWEIWRNPITGKERVTFCHEYIMIW